MLIDHCSGSPAAIGDEWSPHMQVTCKYLTALTTYDSTRRNAFWDHSTLGLPSTNSMSQVHSSLTYLK